MIRSFKCRDTEALFNGKRVARFANIERVATRKLHMLDDATVLQDLAAPPANRLEALKGNPEGSTVSGSTISGACVLCGRTRDRNGWRSWIITEGRFP